jgi:UDP-N-acetyl-D-mannosaminuronic acid dehydrogenase
MDPDTTIHIIGAGFVGLTLTAHFLKTTSNSVVVVDSNIRLIQNLHNNIFQVQEPGLHEILISASLSGRLTFESVEDFSEGQEVFLCISTPPRAPMNPIVDFLHQNVSKFQLNSSVYIRSTVHLGTAVKAKQYLKTVDRSDIRVFSLPERTAEGVALQEITDLPQLVGISKGEEKHKLQEKLESFGFTDLVFEDWSTVELAKLACNVWRDYTFAFGNFMAIMGRRTNINARKAIEIANYRYPRSLIPRPGAVGGPCLSKDALILDESFPMEDSIILKSRKINLFLEDEVIQDISSLIEKRSYNQVILAGMAFKGNPPTNDLRESLGIKILNHIKTHYPKLEVKYWDNSVDIPDIPRLRDEEILSHLSDTLFVLCNDQYDFIEKLNNLRLEHSLVALQTFLYDVTGITRGLNLFDSYVFGEGNLDFS